jgi:hypothetical protein
MFGPMNSFNNPRTKPLTERQLLDLLRAGVILAITVAAALIVPPKVFGATPTHLEPQTCVAQPLR